MKTINFKDFFKEFKEEKNINESVINKISKLYFIKNPEFLVQEFKKIFDIDDNIKLTKIEMGGKYYPDVNIIEYSSNNSLIHELIHYLQAKAGINFERYKIPQFDDIGLLKYILQPMELNNWAISLADEALKFKKFNDFLNIAERTDDFKNSSRNKRLKHIIWLLQSDIIYDKRTKQYKDKLLKLTKQYFLTIKTLSQNIEEFKENFNFINLI